jgi:RNA-binding protein 26
MKKEALKKRLELHKQKQSLLDRQIQQQKLLLDKLEKSKKMNSEEKSAIVQTIKKLATSIDKLKTELAVAVGRLPASGAKAATDISTGAGSAGAVVLRPTKLVRVLPPPATAPVTTPGATPTTTAAVSSTSADSTVVVSEQKADDGLAPKTPEKKTSDSELAQTSTAVSGDSSAETSLLRRRVAALKREAASLGLLSGSPVLSASPVSSSTPFVTSPRGRGIVGGLQRRGRGYAGPLANRTFDRRPRQLLVTGFVADEKEDVLTHLLTFGAVDNSIIDTLVPSISIRYKTRQSAENAVAEGSVYKGKTLTMAWQSADGVLSPKIVPPPPTSTFRSSSFAFQRNAAERKNSGGDTKISSGVGNNGDSELVGSPDNKQLKDDDSDDDDDDADEDALLGADDDDDDEAEGARSWRR